MPGKSLHKSDDIIIFKWISIIKYQNHFHRNIFWHTASDLMDDKSYSCKMLIGTFNSLWPGDVTSIATWIRSALVKAMACCLRAPSHCFNQYWFKGLWHSPESIFTVVIQAIILHNNEFENHTAKITLTSPRDQMRYYWHWRKEGSISKSASRWPLPTWHIHTECLSKGLLA